MRERLAVVRIFGVYLALSLVALLFCGCGNTDGLVVIATTESENGRCVRPVVLLTGSQNLKFSVADMLSEGFKRDHQSTELQAEIVVAGVEYKLDAAMGSWAYAAACAPEAAGWGDLVFRDSGVVVLTLPNVVRVIDSFRVTLTFDDGPAVNRKSLGAGNIGSPTIKTLQALDAFRHGSQGSKTGIKAAFFVLTTPDKFLFFSYPKAENADGKAVLKEVADHGHVLGVHWGGEYKKQSVGHDRRVAQPVYDITGAGDRSFKNALECDLFECTKTIEEVTGQRPIFVRPPFWRYRSPNDPSVERAVKAVYDEFGLQMILTDAKFPDGGYSLISIFSVNKYMLFPKYLRNAFLSGEDNLVISMHDSNSYTANILLNILNMIKDEFEKTSFSGVYAKAGVRLDFADSAEEVVCNLSAKKKYALFPLYNKGL